MDKKSTSLEERNRRQSPRQTPWNQSAAETVKAALETAIPFGGIVSASKLTPYPHTNPRPLWRYYPNLYCNLFAFLFSCYEHAFVNLASNLTSYPHTHARSLWCYCPDLYCNLVATNAPYRALAFLVSCYGHGFCKFNSKMKTNTILTGWYSWMSVVYHLCVVIT